MLVGSAATARLAAGRTRFLGSHEGAFLPMVPEVYQALRARHETQDCPTEGWVFPTASASGHMEEPSAMQWHAKALATLVKAHKEDPGANPEVRPFEPYCLRHTFGTRMARRVTCSRWRASWATARSRSHSDIVTRKPTQSSELLRKWLERGNWSPTVVTVKNDPRKTRKRKRI